MGTQPSRVEYFARQYLRTRDLSDEQAYHLEMRRRHNVAGHSWGIVSGLTLTADDTNRVSVQPGLALDGYGRELVVGGVLPVPDADPRIERGPLDVWLTYDTQTEDPVSRRDNGCAPPQGGSPRRLREGARVLTHKTGLVPGGPTRPSEVPPGDLTFGPDRPAPDSDAQEWPVYLGRITFGPSAADPQVSAWNIDLSERLYAGLVGQRVVAPSSRVAGNSANVKVPEPGALIQMGPARKGDANRFAVYVPGGPDLDPDADDLRLGLDGDGRLSFRGPETRVQGDLVIDNGGAVEFHANGSPAQAGAPENVEPLGPWRVYHYLHLSDEAPTQGTRSPPTTSDGFTEELRVVMSGALGGGTNSVVIGAWSDKGKFVPCLTVASDQNVTVHGNLIVEGSVTYTSAQQAPPDFNPNALNVSQAAANVASFSVPPGTPIEKVLADLLKSGTGRDLLINTVLGLTDAASRLALLLQGSNLSTFLTAVLDSAGGAAAVATALRNGDISAFATALDDGKATALTAALLGRPAVAKDAAGKIASNTAVFSDFVAALTPANTGTLTAAILADTTRATAVGSSFPAAALPAFATGLNAAAPGTQQLGPLGKVLFEDATLIKAVAKGLDAAAPKFADFVDALNAARFGDLVDAILQSKPATGDRMPDVAAKLINSTGKDYLARFAAAVLPTAPGGPTGLLPLLASALLLDSDATQAGNRAQALADAMLTDSDQTKVDARMALFATRLPATEQLLKPFIKGLTTDADNTTHRSARAAAFVSALIDFPNIDAATAPPAADQRLGMWAIDTSLRADLNDPMPFAPALALTGATAIRRVERFMQFLHDVPKVAPMKTDGLIYQALGKAFVNILQRRGTPKGLS